MQLPNVVQLMLIVHTYIKNEATFLFSQFLPYLWVYIIRNLIHKICMDIHTLQNM